MKYSIRFLYPSHFRIFRLLLPAGLLILASCAPSLSPNTYTAGQVNRAERVVKGVIVSSRQVKLNNNSGVGGLAGTVAGGALGSDIGHGTPANVAGAVGGAVVGGLIGNEVEKAVQNQEGHEYIIKLNSGKMISIVQAEGIDLNVGQRVLIVYGRSTRVIPDNTIQTLNPRKHHSDRT